MINAVIDVVDKNITNDTILLFMNNIQRYNPLMLANKTIMDTLIDTIRNDDVISTFVLKNISELTTLHRNDYLDMSLYLVDFYKNFDIIYKDARKIYFTDDSLTELIRNNEILQPLVICNLYHKNKYCIYKGK